MLMNANAKIYIAIAAIAVAGFVGAAVWSGMTIRNLETAAASERQRADTAENAAAQKEQAAAAYREKTEYLERQIAAIQITSRKQDEQLQDLNIDTRNARSRVARVRSTPAVAADCAGLCKKLADAGHPCE